MPCLILTGHPCSGKTALAKLMKEVAEQDFQVSAVVLSDDDSTGGPGNDHSSTFSEKEQQYASPAAEKEARARLKSEFDRLVSRKAPKDLVVVDALNYIKGYRYELYCISKAAQERHGVVWVLSPVEAVRTWNAKACRYSDALLSELMLRYEPPDERNRWDSPLYRVDLHPDDYEESRFSTAKPEDNAVLKTASQVLERTVYDMHKLSSVLNPTEGSSTVSGADSIGSSKSSSASTQGARRAVFKRPNRTVTGPPGATGNSQPAPPSETPPRDDAAAPPPDTATGETRSGSSGQLALPPLRERVRDLLESFLSDARGPLRAGVSTARHEGSSADALHALDSITLRVCAALGASSADGNGGGSVSVKGGEETLPVRLSRPRSAAELQSLRLQYLRWTAAHPPPDGSTEADLARAFVAYLESQRFLATR